MDVLPTIWAYGLAVSPLLLLLPFALLEMRAQKEFEKQFRQKEREKVKNAHRSGLTTSADRIPKRLISRTTREPKSSYAAEIAEHSRERQNRELTLSLLNRSVEISGIVGRGQDALFSSPSTSASALRAKSDVPSGMFCELLPGEERPTETASTTETLLPSKDSPEKVTLH